MDKGIRSLTAMLNRHGYGTVFFGVEDNGNVKGMQIGKNTLLDIRNRVRDLVSPQILVQLDACKDEDGKSYISMSARGSDIPYSCDGRYYIRNVSADENASTAMLRKMLAAGESDIITEISSDIQELTFRQFFVFLGKNGIHTNETIAFYSNYGLYNSEGKYNYMAFLLSDQNNLSMKVVRFKGNDKSSMSERTEFGNQCLLGAMNSILEYIKAINTVQVDLSQGTRVERSLFQYESFREAWINACLHNEWSGKLPPSVFLFDNRIEVVSYGGLPYGLSEEGFYKGNSVPVNRALLTVFILTHFAEQSGHGVPTIVADYGKEAFSFEDGMLKVTISFAFAPDNVIARKEYEKQKQELTDNQKRVFLFLSENPKATQKEIAEALSLSLSGVKRIIYRLQELDFLEREGSKKKGRWITK